jgi:hypothetical protein
MANPQPDEFTRISNELLEAILLSNFTKRQLNIILLVIRLSYGCGKKYAVLRKSDFGIAGIDKSDIKKELALLAESKVLMIEGDRISLNKDYDRWRISLVRAGGREEFKKILQRNLEEKRVGVLPTDQDDQVGKTPTGSAYELVKHQPTGWQNTNQVVGEIPTDQNTQPNGANGSEGSERNIKEILKKSKEKNICVYDPDFEKFWAEYPRKVEKQRAYRCWKTRIREGLSEGLTMEGLVRDLVNAAKNYAADCRKRRTEERYIKHASTFLGPDRPYLDWIKPNEEETEASRRRKLLSELYLS